MTVKESTLERYLGSLLRGDRLQCRSIIEEALRTGVTAGAVYMDIIWPMMAEIEKLARRDRITAVEEHLATRINRTIVDQLQNKLPRSRPRDKKVAIVCADEQIQELGAQMMADLFESDGWNVRLLGGGLTNDDILTFSNDYAPDILMIYGASPKQAPQIRSLIDTIKGVNAWPEMKIMVSGGLFNRAEGLWQEIGADLFAANAVEALEVALHPEKAAAEDRTINRRRKSCRKTLRQEQMQPVAAK
jgi:methanogenic corrinoid protein MtbC1